MLPKEGTLERLLLDKCLEKEEGCSYLDFIGTGITESNIDQIAQNLRNGMYEDEDDNLLKPDA